MRLHVFLEEPCAAMLPQCLSELRCNRGRSEFSGLAGEMSIRAGRQLQAGVSDQLLNFGGL